MIARKRTLLPLSLSLFLLSACLEVAEERAVRELMIGKAQKEGITFEVVDGLASIRQLEYEGDTLRLWLWSQAPRFELKLSKIDHSRFRTIEIKLSNIMSESVLSLSTAERSDEAELVFESPTVAQTSVELFEDEYHFTLHPPSPDPDRTWRFALFADVQERLDGVADLLGPLGKERGVRFALISGDLTERGSLDQLLTFQDQMIRHLPFPCYATLGNHELGTAGVPFHSLFGRGTFSFAYGDARFSLLDGASATIASSSRKNLSRWLKLAKDKLHIFATHIPIIDPDGTRGGAFASRLESASLLDELRIHNVDLLLYGHVHTYRYFYQAGIPAIISGGGGSIPMRFDGIGRHYIVFEIDETRSEITHRVARIYPAD